MDLSGLVVSAALKPLAGFGHGLAGTAASGSGEMIPATVLRKVPKLAFAAIELIIGVLALAGITALIWSLVVILFTPAETWKAAGLVQWMRLIVVIVMPLIGSVLFLALARRRLAAASATSSAAQVAI